MAGQNPRCKDYCITPTSGTPVDVGPCRPDQNLEPDWHESGPIRLVDKDGAHRPGHWLPKLSRGKSVKIAHRLQHGQISHRVKARYATGHGFSCHRKDGSIYPGHNVCGGYNQGSSDHET